jgi:hypothetical protein
MLQFIYKNLPSTNSNIHRKKKLERYPKQDMRKHDQEFHVTPNTMGSDSSAGTATHYELDGLEIKSR